MFFAPGCPGKSPCEQPFLCPGSLSTLSIPSTPRTRAAKRSRQSRRDGRTRKGFAGEVRSVLRERRVRSLRRGARRMALRCFPFSTVDSCFLPFSPAEPKGRAYSLMICSELENCAGVPGEIAFVHSFFCLIFPDFVRFYSLYSLTYQNYLEILAGRRYITQKYQLYLTCREKGK